MHGQWGLAGTALGQGMGYDPPSTTQPLFPAGATANPLQGFLNIHAYIIYNTYLF